MFCSDWKRKRKSEGESIHPNYYNNNPSQISKFPPLFRSKNDQNWRICVVCGVQTSTSTISILLPFSKSKFGTLCVGTFNRNNSKNTSSLGRLEGTASPKILLLSSLSEEFLRDTFIGMTYI